MRWSSRILAGSRTSPKNGLQEVQVMVSRRWLLIVVPLTLACSLVPAVTPTPTAPSETAVVPSGTPPPQPTFTPSPIPSDTPSGPCTFTGSADTKIYTRPDTASDIFFDAPVGFSTELQGQTADGWKGFDPGVAQAANIGPFRLRWIPPDASSFSGDCGSLPVFWGAPAGICFLMPMSDANVYSLPDTTSAVVTVLHLNDFAAMVGQTASGWASVDLAPGNTGSSATGWVSPADLNMNGPCDSLPTVSP
jgi:hypothetical protein